MKEGSDKIKYFLYARKSTESEDKQVLSIESQIGELKRIAERESIKVVQILSESKSAKTLGRPVFNEVIERIAKGDAQGILCWKLDRLARNFIDGGKIIEMLQHGTIQHIRSFERSYYPQDNVLLMSVEFGMANQYSRDLAVNVSRGLRIKAEKGWYPVQPPLGWLNSKTKGKGKNDIFKDPERFDLVRKVFDLMLKGMVTPPKILEIATDEWGLRTRRGKKLSRSNIYYFFTNPFYYGTFEFPARSGNWYKGAHEPMITEEEYDKIQTLLGRKGRPRPKSHVFDFSGMMKCGECGCIITAEEKFKRPKNGKVHHYIYYHCTKRKNPNCAQGSIEATKLREQIIETVEGLKIPPEFHDYAMKWFRERHQKESAGVATVLASQQKAYEACVTRLNNLIDMRAAGEITQEQFAERKTLLEKEKSRLNEYLNDTDHRVSRWVETTEEMFTFIRDAVEKFKTGTMETRRQILSTLGSNLLVKDRKLGIDWEKSLVPAQKLAGVVQQIHKELEPLNKPIDKKEIERLYARNPIVSPH